MGGDPFIQEIKKRGQEGQFWLSATLGPLTFGSSDRGLQLRLTKERVDDWDKSVLFYVSALARRSARHYRRKTPDIITWKYTPNECGNKHPGSVEMHT